MPQDTGTPGRQSLDIETPTGHDHQDNRRKSSGAGEQSPMALIIGGGIVVVVIVVCIVIFASHGGGGGGSSGAEIKPGTAPWWVVKGVVPEGDEKDMGGWQAYPFSTDQQNRFGVDELGTVKSQDKFDKAIAELKNEVTVPWWVMAHVKPEGPVMKLTLEKNRLCHACNFHRCSAKGLRRR